MILQRLSHVFLLAFGWQRWLLAALGGALAALAMPPFGWFPVLALSFPALVWLLDGAIAPGARLAARARAGFVLGWWFGFGFHLAGLWWIGRAFLVDAQLHAWMIPLAVLLLPAGLAIFTGLGVALAAAIWRDGWGRLLALALALAGADALRGNVLSGFPWNTWGYAFGDVLWLAQPAALVGVYGLGLLVTLVFCSLAGFAEPGGGRRAGVAGVLLFLAIGGFGAARLTQAGPPTSEPVALRLVQPSVPQEEKWKPENRSRVFATYLEMSDQPWTGADGGDLPRVVIWPESAVPFLLTNEPGALSAIARMLGPEDTLATGAVRQGEATGSFYNSVYVVDGAGTIRDAYDKVRLVPFGEFLPFGDWLEAIGLTKLVATPGEFRAGYRHRLLAPVTGPLMLPLICYEAIFPEAATSADGRPGWILNVTNDAWFGDTPGPVQHFVQARMRAIEQGVPVVRVANTGISGVVDAQGRVRARLGLGQQGVIDLRLPSSAPPTVYSRTGALILGLLVTVLLGLLLVSRYVGYARKD
ncbi:apolipoprotein N-acyltransferase [Stappia indica]|uniref:apolipoprotein N-acyltransferase n=1 Tax=Stappia indica TaxID=538381 RepID=UPI001CD22EEB|nr:apolipoprotein N-acyltransferase [Stappia indica]MCA1300495.1 apolipoprotein N-acyltransferase [Stappia indica]